MEDTGVNIVIVNWNTGRLLGLCLQALRDLPAAERELIGKIIVVDNNSGDDSVARAKEVGNEEQFVELKENVGFARGNNIGAKEIVNDGHVFLLNPDTEVRPGAIQTLAKVLQERSDVGIVGCKLVNPDGSLQRSVRPFPRFIDFVFYMLKLGRVVQGRQEAQWDYDTPGYVDQVMGAVFFVRREVWDQLEGLDTGFFTLFEEVDFCRRARDAGWRTYFTPAGEVMHVKAASFSQLVGWKKSRPWLKSSLRYVRKHFGPGGFALLMPLVPIFFLLTIPAGLKHLWQKMRNSRRLSAGH